jgi:hypothetical protein
MKPYFELQPSGVSELKGTVNPGRRHESSLVSSNRLRNYALIILSSFIDAVSS